MTAAMMVARKTPPQGMPVLDRICGLTMMMYDIAKNVVRPAMISVDAVVPFSLRWKNFSMFLYLFFPGLIGTRTLRTRSGENRDSPWNTSSERAHPSTAMGHRDHGVHGRLAETSP